MVDLWRRGDSVVAVPHDGVSERELAKRLLPAGTHIEDPAAAIADFFARSFAGSNLHYASTIDEQAHRPSETAPW